MGSFISSADLEPFARIDPLKAEEMITDAESMAILTAPCLPDLLTSPTGESEQDALRRKAKLGALKAILRGALLRWNEAGTGALSARQSTFGPFGQSETIDTRQTRRAMFWPTEIEQLQALCRTGKAKAFAIDTAPDPVGAHPPWCSLMFGGPVCSCGVALTGDPSWEEP